MSPDKRAALYVALAAITPLLVVYGALTESTAALWLALAKAVIDAAALILARQHVPADE